METIHSGFHERNQNSPKIGNTHVYINYDGEIKATYQKTHLFDVEIPDRGVRLQESDYVSPGQSIVEPVIMLEGSPFRLGLTICYDLRL